MSFNPFDKFKYCVIAGFAYALGRFLFQAIKDFF